MKLKASLVDFILFIITILAGASSPREFVAMFAITMLWFTLHLALSKNTLKRLRETIIVKYIKGDE